MANLLSKPVQMQMAIISSMLMVLLKCGERRVLNTYAKQLPVPGMSALEFQLLSLLLLRQNVWLPFKK